VKYQGTGKAIDDWQEPKIHHSDTRGKKDQTIKNRFVKVFKKNLEQLRLSIKCDWGRDMAKHKTLSKDVIIKFFSYIRQTLGNAARMKTRTIF
jgi:hypothetical protein